VLQAARELVDSWADTPPHVLASIKELINDAPQCHLSEQLASEKQHFLVNFMRPEAGHAIGQFLSRKKAVKGSGSIR
jgi:enoyl-CoA hydratase/carnithine racemase